MRTLRLCLLQAVFLVGCWTVATWIANIFLRAPAPVALIVFLLATWTLVKIARWRRVPSI